MLNQLKGELSFILQPGEKLEEKSQSATNGNTVWRALTNWLYLESEFQFTARWEIQG